MDWKLEVVVDPVTDVERSKAFYADQLGFVVDLDDSPRPGIRVVQLTPPGSGCSVTIGTGIGEGVPGTLKGVQLCVGDIEAAHADLAAKGIPVSAPFHFGPQGMADGPDPQRRSYNSFMQFPDPDGNVWLVQEVHRAADGSAS